MLELPADFADTTGPHTEYAVVAAVARSAVASERHTVAVVAVAVVAVAAAAAVVVAAAEWSLRVMGMDFFAGDYLGSFAVVAEELEALACDPFAAAAPAEPLEVLPLVVVVRSFPLAAADWGWQRREVCLGAAFVAAVAGWPAAGSGPHLPAAAVAAVPLSWQLVGLALSNIAVAAVVAAITSFDMLAGCG